MDDLKIENPPVSARGWPVIGAIAFWFSSLICLPGVNVVLTEVPDYAWDAGCFGTASGNLIGYWDRHGFPNFYAGPTGGGVAPLNSDSKANNDGIRALWATRAGLDGRPADQPGHWDDYWVVYESTIPDPYVKAGRKEHAPDCIGDFIGLSQNKWTDLNGECDGNIDAFSFVFWDSTGDKRFNYIPEPQNNRPVPDIPSGLKAFSAWRGYAVDVFSQLTDFNPSVESGHGFSFADLKAEIDAGYPVLLYLQNQHLSRALPGMPHANPEIHGMLAYGYYLPDSGDQYVRYRTSWASGDNILSKWDGELWQANLPVRGVIGFHPHPQITKIAPSGNGLVIEWDGPSAVLSNIVTHTSTSVHRYILEKATALEPPDFQPVSDPTFERQMILTNCCSDQTSFYRLKLLSVGNGD